MNNYEVDFSYLIREGAATVINADDIETAEDQAFEYVRDTFPEAFDIQIENVKLIEVKV